MQLADFDQVFHDGQQVGTGPPEQLLRHSRLARAILKPGHLGGDAHENLVRALRSQLLGADAQCPKGQTGFRATLLGVEHRFGELLQATGQHLGVGAREFGHRRQCREVLHRGAGAFGELLQTSGRADHAFDLAHQGVKAGKGREPHPEAGQRVLDDPELGIDALGRVLGHLLGPPQITLELGHIGSELNDKGT